MLQKTIEFISRLKSIKNPNLEDKKTISDFGNRLISKRRKEIEKQNTIQRNSISRSFTIIVR